MGFPLRVPLPEQGVLALYFKGSGLEFGALWFRGLGFGGLGSLRFHSRVPLRVPFKNFLEGLLLESFWRFSRVQGSNPYTS